MFLVITALWSPCSLPRLTKEGSSTKQQAKHVDHSRFRTPLLNWVISTVRSVGGIFSTRVSSGLPSYTPLTFCLVQWVLGFSLGSPLTELRGMSLDAVEPSLIPSPGTHTLGSPFLSVRMAVNAPCVASSRLRHWWGHQEGDMICQSLESSEHLGLIAKREQFSPSVQETAGRAHNQGTACTDGTCVFRCLGQTRFTEIQFFWHMVMRKLFLSYLIIKVFLVSGFIWGRLSDL